MKLFVALWFLLYTASSYAHELSTSYIDTTLLGDGSVKGTISIEVLELKDHVVLDTNLDRILTWKELNQGTEKIKEAITKGFSLSRANENCFLVISDEISLMDIISDTYIVVPFTAQCSLVGALTIKYDMFFDLALAHKSILTLQAGHKEYLLVFTQANSRISVTVEDGSKMQTFRSFVYQGMFHIALGFDHVLFLLTLLLTVCLVKGESGWQAMTLRKDIVIRTVWILISFSLAHSMTLTSTALGVLPALGSWVDVIIAASILFNVTNNLYPFLRRLAIISFIFGLLHGVEFAGTLSELDLPPDQNLLAIAAFNIGVALGQLGLLLIVMPILISYRNSIVYKKWVMPVLSLLISGLVLYWIFIRLFA